MRHTCPICGYDLTAIPSGVCPECGRPVHRFTERVRQVLAEANAQAMTLLTAGDSQMPPLPWWKPRVFLQPISSPFDLLVDSSIPRRAISPRHMLLGILAGPQGVGYHALCACGIDPENMRQAILKLFPRCAPLRIAADAKLPISTTSQAVIKEAIDQAYRMNQDWVGTEHLVLALTRVTGYESVSDTLASLEVREEQLRSVIVGHVAALREKPPPR